MFRNIFCFILLLQNIICNAQKRYFISVTSNDFAIAKYNQTKVITQTKTNTSDYFTRPVYNFGASILNQSVQVGWVKNATERGFGFGFGNNVYNNYEDRIRTIIGSTKYDSTFENNIYKSKMHYYNTNFYIDKIFKMNNKFEYVLGFQTELYFTPGEKEYQQKKFQNISNSGPNSNVLTSTKINIKENNFVNFNNFLTTKFATNIKQFQLGIAVKWGLQMALVNDDGIANEEKINLQTNTIIYTVTKTVHYKYVGASFIYLPYFNVKYFFKKNK
jgi:hypothetical protein